MTLWTHSLVTAFTDSPVLIASLVSLCLLSIICLLQFTYIKAPSRVLKLLETETCQHFTASRHLPPNAINGETVIALEARPSPFTHACWPHKALFLYLGHKNRGSKLNGKLGDRKNRQEPQTLVSLRGSDLLAGVDRRRIRWRRWDGALALIDGSYHGPAHLIHGVDHQQIRSQRTSPFDFH